MALCTSQICCKICNACNLFNITVPLLDMLQRSDIKLETFCRIEFKLMRLIEEANAFFATRLRTVNSGVFMKRNVKSHDTKGCKTFCLFQITPWVLDTGKLKSSLLQALPSQCYKISLITLKVKNMPLKLINIRQWKFSIHLTQYCSGCYCYCRSVVINSP